MELVFQKETYLLRGILYNIHNQLGSQQKEKIYSKALEIAFSRNKIPFEKEKQMVLDFEGEKLGNLFIDFVAWNKIGIELKAKPAVNREDFRQAVKYGETLGLSLVLLVNFGSKLGELYIKRILIKNQHLK